MVAGLWWFSVLHFSCVSVEGMVGFCLAHNTAAPWTCVVGMSSVALSRIGGLAEAVVTSVCWSWDRRRFGLITELLRVTWWFLYPLLDEVL